MLRLQVIRLNQDRMNSICWLGKSQSYETILMELGFSKQKIKKIGLSKKERSRIIQEKAELKLPNDLFNQGIIFPCYLGQERPRVIEQREHFLAIHKPSYVHIHPLSYGEGDNLLSFLRESNYFSYLQNFSESSLWDGGLLFRLDYETSGLVILCNSKDEYLKSRESITLKEYLVVVEGHYDALEGDICHYLSTSGTVVKVDEKSGAESHLELQVLKTSPEKSLLKVTLKEGRRHQIRVQLSALGFPIWGDVLYGAKAQKEFGLHCHRYILVNGMEFRDDYFWGTSWT